MKKSNIEFLIEKIKNNSLRVIENPDGKVFILFMREYQVGNRMCVLGIKIEKIIFTTDDFSENIYCGEKFYFYLSSEISRTVKFLTELEKDTLTEWLRLYQRISSFTTEKIINITVSSN